MPDTMLVTYATRYGSTREVAEAIAAALREQGHTVDVQPAKKVASLDAYTAVILGAPLYIGRLLADAGRFLNRHQKALQQRPLAFFALGPLKADEVQEPQAQLDKELAKYPWLKPVDAQLFIGSMDPARFRFPDSLLSALPASPLHNTPASDNRDWDAIRAWAGQLPARLH